MENNENDHRREKRLERHFILRARPIAFSEKAVWDISTVRNISVTGVLFYSSKYYDYNSEIEVRIKSPMAPEEIIFIGNVVRCSALGNMSSIYSVAVEITSVEEKSKAALDKTIKFFADK